MNGRFFFSSLFVLFWMANGWTQSPNEEVSGDSLFNLAKEWKLKGNENKHDQFLIESEEIFTETNDLAGLLRIRNWQASRLIEISDDFGVIKLLEKTEKELISRMEGAFPEKAEAYSYLAEAQAHRSFWSAAQKNFSRAYQMAIETEMDSTFVLRTLLNQVSCQPNLGNYPEQIRISNLAKKFSLFASENARLEAQNLSFIHFNLSKAHGRMGNLSLQSTMLDLAWEDLINFPNDFQSERANIFLEKAGTYKKLKNFEAEITNLEKARALLLPLLVETDPRIAEVETRLGFAQAGLGQLQKGIDHLEKALSIREKSEGKTHYATARVHLNLAELFGEAGQPRLQRSHAKLGHSLLKERFGSKHPDVNQAWLHLADYYLGVDSGEFALAACQMALQVLCDTFPPEDDFRNPYVKDSYNPVSILRTLVKKAEILEQVAHRKEIPALYSAAFATGQVALQTLESIQATQTGLSVEGEFDLWQEGLPIFDSMIRMGLREHARTGQFQYLEASFLMVERSKSIHWTEAMRDKQDRITGGVPPELLFREQELSLDLVRKEAALRNTAKSQMEKIKSLEAKRLQLRKELTSINLEIREKYPTYAHLKLGLDTLTLGRIRGAKSMKSPGALLIEYFSGKNAIYAFALNQKNLVFQVIPKNEKLLEWLSIQQNAISNDPTTQSGTISPENRSLINTAYRAEAGPGLYRLLIKPLLDKFPSGEINKLYIVPDGELWQLPFETLLTEVELTENDWDLDYLIKKFPISYQFSGALMKAEFNKQKDGLGLDWVALKNENPAYLENDFNRLSELFDGQKETFSKAKKSNFIQNLNRAKVVYLYLPATQNNKDALDYQLTFTQDSLSDSLHELHSFELFDLSTQSSLVILGSTKSVLGEDLVGNGALQMGRSFSYAGAKSVMFSHWRVRENKIHPILIPFFRTVLAGKSQDISLWYAKNEYLKDPRGYDFDKPMTTIDRHPYFWAGIVHYGDLPPLDKRGITWWQILFGIVALWLGFRLFARKRK